MSVASKNPYDLLGNDDGDSDTPKAPVKTVDKTSSHTVKRNTDGLAPSQAPVTGTRRGGSARGNDGAFRDRDAGSDRNRAKPTDEAHGGAPRGGHHARARGGRGGRFRSDRDDRHSKNNIATTTEKAENQGWGAVDGEAELKDEQAGEAMAETEKKEAAAEGEGTNDAEEGEPENKSISLADYLAQQAEKKLALEAENALKLRQPNEGVKEDKKWAGAKPLVKDEDEDYFAPSGGKAKRERERKTKTFVEIDNRYVEPERTRGGRGGRGDFRGGRGDREGGRGDFRGGRGDRGEGGRGDFRGGRGDREGGRGRGRGGPRGDFRGGDRGGDFRGGRGGSRSEGQPLNTGDPAAFPSLGS